MSNDTDLIKLYSGRILALAADIPHLGRLDAPDASVTRRSPLCGSSVTVDVKVTAGRLSALGQDATLQQVQLGRDQLKAMLKGNGGVPDAPFDGFEVLTPAVEYKNRHASILLAIEALAEAMATAQQDV